jgi:hypothetical protein
MAEHCEDCERGVLCPGVYAATRLDALRKLRREGYAVVTIPQAIQERMKAEGIPVGTDDPTLLALGARPLDAEHQCRYPAPNGQGFPVNQCLDCGGWIIAEPDMHPPTTASPRPEGAGHDD